MTEHCWTWSHWSVPWQRPTWPSLKTLNWSESSLDSETFTGELLLLDFFNAELFPGRYWWSLRCSQGGTGGVWDVPREVLVESEMFPGRYWWSLRCSQGGTGGVWDVPREVLVECEMFPERYWWSVRCSQGGTGGVWDVPKEVLVECEMFPGRYWWSLRCSQRGTGGVWDRGRVMDRRGGLGGIFVWNILLQWAAMWVILMFHWLWRAEWQNGVYKTTTLVNKGEPKYIIMKYL